MTTSNTTTPPTTAQTFPATPTAPPPVRSLVLAHGDEGQASKGYLAAIAGGAAGAAALATAGVMVGLAMIPIFENPNGGMENLALLLIPLALGALGVLAGMWVGVWAGLRRANHDGAMATAWLTAPLGVFGMFAAPGFFPIGALVLLILVPALARYIVVKANGR